MPNSYLHYLTSGAETEAANNARRGGRPHGSANNPPKLEPSTIGVVVHEDSDFIAENFPDGIPKELHKDDLSVKDAKIVALHVAGYKRSEIAEMVGVCEGDVTLILRHPSAKKVINELTQKILKETISTVKSEYIAHAHDAFKTTLFLMRYSKNDRVKLEAARDITKAAGVLDNNDADNRTPIDSESAKIISETLRELTAETKEFTPLGNSSDLDAIRAELEAAEDIDAIIEETKTRS